MKDKRIADLKKVRYILSTSLTTSSSLSLKLSLPHPSLLFILTLLSLSQRIDDGGTDSDSKLFLPDHEQSKDTPLKDNTTRCIGPGCTNMATKPSIYCGDSCIERHVALMCDHCSKYLAHCILVFLLSKLGCRGLRLTSTIQL